MISVLVIALSASLLIPAMHDGTGSSEPDSATVDSILRLERSWERAIANDDYPVIDRTVASDYVFVSLTGQILNSAEAQAEKFGRLKWATATIKEIQVRIFATSAIVVGLTREVSKGKDDPVIVQYRWSHVFVQKHNAWQVVSEQWTRVN